MNANPIVNANANANLWMRVYRANAGMMVIAHIHIRRIICMMLSMMNTHTPQDHGATQKFTALMCAVFAAIAALS